MLEKGLIGWKEIQYIWNLVPHTDFRGRATVEKLLGDISKNLPLEFISHLIDRLLEVKETDITIDKLNLLRTLKDRELSVQYKVKILNHLWELLTVKSTNIQAKIEEEIEKVFRSFIGTIKDPRLKLQVVKNILSRLREITSTRQELYLFKEFINTYPAKLELPKPPAEKEDGDKRSGEEGEKEGKAADEAADKGEKKAQGEAKQ